MCSYEVVAKDVSFESTVDKLSAEVSKTLDNVFIIFDEEVTGGNQKHLNIYVYDGNFIRDSFEEELLEFSDKIFPKVYSLHCQPLAPPCSVGRYCHAQSLRVKEVISHRNVIDQLHDANAKFNYFNMVGGLVVNREVDRLTKNVKRSFMDNTWSAFTFFLSLFSQMFTPMQDLFSSEFVDTIEGHPKDKSVIIEYQKKFNVCSDGCVRLTICYKADKIDQTVSVKMMNERHRGKMSGVYESANGSFGVDFTEDSKDYYPKSKSKKCFYEEYAVYNRNGGNEVYEDHGYKHLFENHHSCEEAKGKMPNL